ncbi:Isoflavone reductase [Cytospora mali]|uniref:Isoflavone reductase n=1 Tax=Cytospora mali TaxID=578113 RepID=A0A194VEU9_CYTMA|nr:Isoflavone reductase [Valsa mali var. pyri (nom. inval.)]
MVAITSKKILVLGSTGVIGKVLVNALISANANFERIGIFTSAETVDNKKDLIESYRSKGVDIVIGDVNDDNDMLEAFKGFDTVVSAVGRFGIDKQIDLISLAERCPNIIRFIPSEYGTDVAYNSDSSKEEPHQKKLRVRAYLESNSIRRLKYAYLVTGPFADLYVGCMAKEPQMGSFDVERKQATLLGDGTGRVSLTTMADVGRLLVAVLKHPEFCDNKSVKVNSFTTTPQDILTEFERQTDSKWEVGYTSMDELKRLEGSAWKTGNELATIYTLRRIWTEGSTLYDQTDNEAIGMTKMDTLEMVVQEAVSNPVSAFQSGKL